MLRSLAVAALLIALARPATFAQIPVLPGIPDTQQSDNTLDDLQSAFPHIAWNGKTQGLLLAVRPGEVRWLGPDWEPYTDILDPLDPDGSDEATQMPLLVPKDRYGLNASLVARHFRQKLIHVGTVTVFAPQTMILLNQELKPANPVVEMDKLSRLEASLTTEQWKLLGSPEGLGSANLTPAQIPFFEALLPDSGSIYRRTKMIPATDSTAEPVASNIDTPLPEEQRKAIHLRIDRTANFSLMTGDADYYQDLHETFSNSPADSESSEFVAPPDSFEESKSRFGQQLSLRVPNHLKPSDLDLKAATLDAGVSIAEAKTVGDLIRAVKTRTGLELYADGRLASLTVAIAGGSSIVRAGDLLEALDWALTATWRKVGPPLSNAKDVVYVLTYDREGIAIQRGHIDRWLERGEGVTQRADRQLRELIAKRKPGQYFTFHPGNLLNPSPEALKATENAPDPTEIVIPVSELTATQRQQMQAGLKRIQKKYEEMPPGSNEDKPVLRTDRVQMQLTHQLVCILPGVGDVVAGTDDEGELDAQKNPQDDDDIAATKPVSGKHIILAVAAPRTSEETKTLLALAAGRGVHQVWIRAEDAPPTILAACVAAGKTCHLPIGVVFDLMRVPSDNLPPISQNVNVFGQTGTLLAADVAQHAEEASFAEPLLEEAVPATDVRDPASPETLAALKALVLPLAKTPGLNTLIFNAAAAPGYEWITRPYYEERIGSDFGYTLQNRIAFIRREGSDPIDFDFAMARSHLGAVAYLPFFDEQPGTPSDALAKFSDTTAIWDDLRTRQQTHLLEALRASLDNADHGLPIYLSQNGNDDYQLWHKSESLVSRSSNDPTQQSKPTIPRYRHQHDVYAKAIAEGERISPISEPGWIAMHLRNEFQVFPQENTPVPEFAVLDLTSMPVHEALPLIEGALLPAK